MSYLTSYDSAESKSSGLLGTVDIEQLSKSRNVKDGLNSTEWLKRHDRKFSSHTVSTRVYHQATPAVIAVAAVAHQPEVVAVPAQGVLGDPGYIPAVLQVPEIHEVVGVLGAPAQPANSEQITLRGQEIMTIAALAQLDPFKRNLALCITFAESMAQEVISMISILQRRQVESSIELTRRIGETSVYFQRYGKSYVTKLITRLLLCKMWSKRSCAISRATRRTVYRSTSPSLPLP